MSDKDFTWGGPNENLCALCVNGCSQLNISGFTIPEQPRKQDGCCLDQALWISVQHNSYLNQKKLKLQITQKKLDQVQTKFSLGTLKNGLWLDVPSHITF